MPETPDLRALADEDLMQLVRRGDPRAFEVVYERHSGAAFSLAYRMVGRGNVAEDVVQEAFLSLWRSRRPLRARPRLGAHVGARDRPPPRDRPAAALRPCTTKRRASDEGIEERLESGERTDVEVARRDEARRSARRWRRCPPSSRT